MESPTFLQYSSISSSVFMQFCFPEGSVTHFPEIKSLCCVFFPQFIAMAGSAFCSP